MADQRKAYIFAGLSVLCWSTVATAFKIALKYQSPYELLFWSSITSFLVFFIFSVLNKNINPLKNIKINDVIRSSLYGFLNPFLYYIVLFEAYSRLSAQEAQSLNYTWGIVMGVFSVIFLKETFKIRNIFALLLSFIGVVVISTKGDVFGLNFTDNLGVVLALGSSLIWASYWILNVKDKRQDVNKLFWNFLFGSIYISILMFYKGLKNISFNAVFSSAYVGIFEMGLTFLLWMTALRYTKDTSKISNIIYLSPFVSLIIISVVLNEVIHLSTIIGLILIVFGIILQNIKK